MMSPRLVDYHCHLDLYQDPKNVFAAARLRDVEILAVTTTPLAWKHNCEFARNTPNVRIGLGLHPQLIGQAVADIEAFAQLVPRARFVGEVGLDAGPRYYRSLDMQQSILGDVLRLCVAHGPKILSMHCVRAFKQLFALLDTHWQPDAGTIVLHWFSGSRSDLKKAVQRGCFFSINAQMKSVPLESEPSWKSQSSECSLKLMDLLRNAPRGNRTCPETCLRRFNSSLL